MRPPGVIAVVGVVALALAVAGCGSSSSPGVAHLSAAKGSGASTSEGGGSGPESRAGAQQKMVAYARCMRSHGVAGFPEPVEGRLMLRGGPGSGLDPGSAQFQGADRACHGLLPEGGKPSPQMQKQAEERALKFSACMRSHGIPTFPEPEFHAGGVTLKLQAGRAGGIDPRSPQFQAAQKACRAYFGPPGSKGGPGGPEASAQSGPEGPGAKQGSGVAVAP
ncbi:MAG: hypothetical protein KGJ43_04315 [Acidobacteriota bacterium]|nr:hypothetical protein [Acidobacteriota bacterium]